MFSIVFQSDRSAWTNFRSRSCSSGATTSTRCAFSCVASTTQARLHAPMTSHTIHRTCPTTHTLKTVRLTFCSIKKKISRLLHCGYTCPFVFASHSMGNALNFHVRLLFSLFCSRTAPLCEVLTIRGLSLPSLDVTSVVGAPATATA